MSTNGPDVSDDILDAVRAVHSGGRPPDGVFPDPVVLSEVADGRRRGLTVREQASAVEALARHPHGGDDPETYLRLARDPETPSAVRTSAVAGLRFLPPDQAEPAALDLLDAADERLVSTAVGTLAVVGRERAFQVLGEHFEVDEAVGTLGDPSSFEDAQTGRVAFARAVVGHRHGLTGTPRFEVGGVDRDRLDAPGLAGAPVDFSGSVRDHMGGPLYGVEPREDAVELGAGIKGVPPLTLVLDRNVTADLSGMAAGPSLPGIVLARAEEVDGYEPDLLVLGDPVKEEQGVDITVVRVDGKAVYAGRGVPDDDGLNVSLSDTGLVGTAPTRLRLHLDPNGVTVVEGAVDPASAVTLTPASWSAD